MAGRSKKPTDHVAYEKALGERLRQMRKAQFPDDGEMESRRKFAEGAGLTETAYEKMEQRGAMTAFAVMRICSAYGISPFELLDVPLIGEQLSTAAARIAVIAGRLSDEHQKQLLRQAQQLPARPIVQAPKRKKQAHNA